MVGSSQPTPVADMEPTADVLARLKRAVGRDMELSGAYEEGKAHDRFVDFFRQEGALIF